MWRRPLWHKVCPFWHRPTHTLRELCDMESVSPITGRHRQGELCDMGYLPLITGRHRQGELCDIGYVPLITGWNRQKVRVRPYLQGDKKQKNTHPARISWSDILILDIPSLASSSIWIASGLRERQSQHLIEESIEPERTIVKVRKALFRMENWHEKYSTTVYYNLAHLERGQ